MDGFEEYDIAGVTVKARKSDGGGFYDVILPDGTTSRIIAEAFEDVARRKQ